MAEREASSPGAAADVDEERRLPSEGRRRHVGSVELGGAAGQVNTNDVVEIAHQPGRQQRAMAQVRSSLLYVRSSPQGIVTSRLLFHLGDLGASQA